MKIRTNLYLITAVLLTSNFLTLCEGDNDIDHEPFSDHLVHLDFLDDLHDTNDFDDNNVIHRVELVQHNGDSMTKYATTSHSNQEINNELFSNTIPIIQQSNVPTTFTKVVKQTVIKKSNNDGNNSPKTDLSIKDIYSNNKLNKNGIGNMENIGLTSIPSQQASDLQGNIKNIIHTTVTKTTTSGSPSIELNESFNRIHNLNALPSNNIISTISSANSNYNHGTTGSSSSQSNSMDENSKIKTISRTEDIIDENGFDNSKIISRPPGGSFRRMKTTIIKQHNINDSNDRSDLGKSTIGFNREDTSSNNIVSSMINPLGYNTLTSTTVDRDNNVINNEIPSRRQQTRFNKLNTLGNSVSETGTLQNPGSFVQTKTTLIQNERTADGMKLDDLNDNKIDYNIGDGMSTSNNIVNSNYIKSSDNNGNDEGSGYGYSYGYGNGMDSGNYNNNNNIIFSNHLMDGASSGGYSSYILSNGYSKGNGMRKKRKKNGSTKKYKGGRSKNLAYVKSKGNGQIRVKKGRNYENTRSSKNRSGGNSQYYSTNYVRGGQSKSFSSSASSSDESSINEKKEPCHCNKERKLNKRDSNESNGSSHLKEHHGPGSDDLGNSMDNQPMQNNGDFNSEFPPPPPPSMGDELQRNLLFDMMEGQGSDPLLNYRQSDITTVLNGKEEMKSQLINDQLPNVDISNQYLTYQIPNTASLHKSDSQQEQYFGSLGLGPRPGHGQGHGPGTRPGHGPGHGSGPRPGHGPGPRPGHGPGPRPGHGPGPRPGHGPGPRPGHGPGRRPGHGPGHGSGRRPGHGHGPGPQSNPFDSKSFIGGEYQNYSEQNLQPPPLSQSPYPYSFNKDYYSDFSSMGSTTPAFTDIPSGQENQININSDLPQMQQDIEGTGFNRMDALNSGSMTTHTQSKMIRNTDDGPIIQYFKTIKTTENIDGNGTPGLQIVQTQSVQPDVDSYGNYIV